MLSHDEIHTYLHAVNELLARRGVTGEICLFGGTVMCLVYNARPSTKDVDAIFAPAAEIRRAARAVADQYDLPEDWLNDAVKRFVVPHAQRIFLDLPNLKVYVPEPDYLLAMKAMAARFDTQDADDLRFLIGLLDLPSPDAVFAIVETYYPRQQIKPATRYFVEELFDDEHLARSQTKH
jgi:hypothetical protein